MKWIKNAVKQSVHVGFKSNKIRLRYWFEKSGAYFQWKIYEKSDNFYDQLFQHQSTEFLPLNQYAGVEGEIVRDVVRTHQTNPYFQSDGQAKLYNVLRGVSIFCPEVGYCQGMNYVGAMILLLAESTTHTKFIKPSMSPDECAFWILVSVIENHSMKDLWRPGMPSLHLCVYQFHQLLEAYLPKLSGHLRRIGLSVDFFVTQWFMTLYTRVLPLDVVHHVWDILLVDGEKILFRVGLAILQRLENRMLLMDVEESSIYFRKNPKMGMNDVSSDILLQQARGFKVTRSMLNKLEQEHKIQKMHARLYDAPYTEVPGVYLISEHASDEETLSNLNHIRKELRMIEACVTDDATVMKSKIEKAEKRLRSSQTLFYQLQYSVVEMTTNLEELLELKNHLQLQLRQLLLESIDRSSRTRENTLDSSCNAVPIQVLQKELENDNDVVSRLRFCLDRVYGAEIRSNTTTTMPRHSCYNLQPPWVSLDDIVLGEDLRAFQYKLETLSQQIRTTHEELETTQVEFVNAQTELEEILEFKESLCSQLIQMVNENEDRKVRRMEQLFREMDHGTN